VGSVIHLVADQFHLITFAVFAAASFFIIRRSRREPARLPEPTGLAAVRTAAIASAVSLALLVIGGLALAWMLRGLLSTGYSYRNYPAPAPPEPVSQALAIFSALVLGLVIPAAVFLAVLDIYAIWPPRSRDRAGAAGRAFGGMFLVVVGVLVSDQIQGAVASAAEREAKTEERRAIEARSAGLSMVVTVVDAQLGEPTENGRIVSHLTLDIAFRSATEIQLLQTEPGAPGNQWITLVPPRPSVGVQPRGGLGLPTHIPTGFDATYRLEVPVDEMTATTDVPAPGREAADLFTTGRWEALLFLTGAQGEPGSRFMYETTAPFVVLDAP
jgi:hypothetical protein